MESRRTLGLAALLALLFGSPGAATPVTVFFNGPSGFGVAEADALAASATFGVPIIEPAVLGSASGTLDVVSQVLDPLSITPNPPTAPSGNQATSTWTVHMVDFSRTVPERKGDVIHQVIVRRTEALPHGPR